MFGGGNPISRIEIDGHYAIEDGGGNGGLTPRPTPPPVTPPQVPNNAGQEINESMGLPAGASLQQQAIRMSQLGINPAIAGFKLGAEEADRAGVDEAIETLADVTGTKDAAECGFEHDVKACGMSARVAFPFGKLGKLAKALWGLRIAGKAASSLKRPEELAAIASRIKHAPDVHDAQLSQQVIAVGTDADGTLVAASNTSSSFTRGQRAIMEEMGVLQAPSRTVVGDKLHAEENLLGAMPNPTGIGTSSLEPCADRCYPLLASFGIPWATAR
jgi:hypothetical protein